MPKLSIIVPVYKVEPYLERCVNSILSQSFTDFELILVNDGSPDRCPQMCDDFSARDSRVKVIHKENGGLSSARNAGLDIASGEYIAFVDSDDWIDKKMYEDMLGHAEKLNADLVVCGINFCNEDEIVIGKWQNITHTQVITGEMAVKDFFPHYFNDIRSYAWNKLYRRHLFQSLRYPVNVIYEDHFIILDLLSKCENIVLLKDYYYNYFSTRTASITNITFSPQKLDLIAAWKYVYEFFCLTKNASQMHHALNYYADQYIKFKQVIWLKFPQHKIAFKRYSKQFDYSSFLLCRGVCKMKKLTFILSHISPRTSLLICKKLFPECIHPNLKELH